MSSLLRLLCCFNLFISVAVWKVRQFRIWRSTEKCFGRTASVPHCSAVAMSGQLSPRRLLQGLYAGWHPCDQHIRPRNELLPARRLHGYHAGRRLPTVMVFHIGMNTSLSHWKQPLGQHRPKNELPLWDLAKTPTCRQTWTTCIQLVYVVL